MSHNPELDLAIQFIEKTDRNLFVTGKAGTGKTTLLHQIKNETFKRVVVVAPTGVAAINAKGVTIHSFFQLPFGPLLPNSINSAFNQQRKFSKAKIDILKSLDLLIIDEISMVRADLLDGIDQVLKRYKRSNSVFGGVQVLCFGDIQQLAPVVKSNEWMLLQAHYRTPYFFSSKAYAEGDFVPIELKKIYRQENEEFITILNEIRNDQLSEKSLQKLNQHYNSTFTPDPSEGYITLTTHNKSANAINKKELDNLKGKSRIYKADVSGSFNETSYPNDEELTLKAGSQVMFIKNDSSPEKRYYNGKIGTITKMTKEDVTVLCQDDGEEIVTEYETWDNVKYNIDQETQEIKEEITGIFKQIPLRLAWAITIHKSQGLTFDKAIIDAGASFAHGQTYVALSRCTSLEGLVLKSRIQNKSIINDQTVVGFNQYIEENHPDEEVLNKSERQFQLNLISELFDFNPFLVPLQRMIRVFQSNRSSIKGEVFNHLEMIKDQGIIPLLKVGNQFKVQLSKLSRENYLPENDPIIQERFTKGVDYFLNQMITSIVQPFSKISFSSDNKQVKKDFEKSYNDFSEVMNQKVFLLKNSTEKFGVHSYLKFRAEAALQNSEKKKPKRLKTNSEPLLAVKLRELRSNISEALQIPPFQVFTQETLYNMCNELPRTEKQLLKVKGMGKIRVQNYGDEILEVIESYCKDNGIDVFNEQKKELKKPTKQISLELFKQGLSIEEIAKERKLKKATIESHLASYIPSGDVDILELMPLKRYKKLMNQIESIEFKNLTDLKEKVDKDFTYMELRMVMLTMEN